MMMLAVYILTALLFSLSDANQEKISHQVALDGNGRMHLSWTVHRGTITMEVTAQALGYVGIGFSPTGGMKGSDIVMGWVTNDGKVVFKDMHAVGLSAPVEDESQDYELIGAEQNDTHTIIRFRRNMRTCDIERDFPLSADTTRIIYAYTDTDPAETDLPYHGVTQRGTKSVYLTLKDIAAVEEKLKDYETWDIKADDFEVPNAKDTYYLCKIVKVPRFEKKQHVIGYSAFVTPGMEPYVHHMMVYSCAHPVLDNAATFEKYLSLEAGAECYSPNMPEEWGLCRPVLAGWAVGGEGQLFPETAGAPLGEQHGGYDYFMLEVHYDNPLRTAGLIDNSGMRMYHTDELRQYDSGTFILGYPVSPFQVVPPRQESFTTVGMCPSQCTAASFPPEGVKLFQVILHAHLAGRAIRLRHFRGETELPPVSIDNHYDFNFQQTRSIEPEVTVLPGDTLVSECIYNTEDRDTTVFGGLTTGDEMCLVVVSYYPRVEMGVCLTQYTPFDIARGAGFEYADPAGLLEFLKTAGPAFDPVAIAKATRVGGPVADLNLNMFEYLVGVVNWDAETSARFHNVTTKDPQAIKCSGRGLQNILDGPAVAINPSKEVGRYSKAYLNAERPASCKRDQERFKLKSQWKSDFFRKISNSVG